MQDTSGVPVNPDTFSSLLQRKVDLHFSYKGTRDFTAIFDGMKHEIDSRCAFRTRKVFSWTTQIPIDPVPWHSCLLLRLHPRLNPTRKSIKTLSSSTLRICCLNLRSGSTMWRIMRNPRVSRRRLKFFKSLFLESCWLHGLPFSQRPNMYSR